jgi:hypothetical protein
MKKAYKEIQSGMEKVRSNINVVNINITGVRDTVLIERSVDAKEFDSNTPCAAVRTPCFPARTPGYLWVLLLVAAIVTIIQLSILIEDLLNSWC